MGNWGAECGFCDELGEPLQRCIKSVEAIRSITVSCTDLYLIVKVDRTAVRFFSCDQLGRLDRPLIKKIGQDYYEPSVGGGLTDSLQFL